MRLLVAGGDRVDAGKTTFAVGLAAFLRDDDRVAGSVAAFKPRAGNDYWFDHDDVLAATADGRLYGKDVRRLTDVAGGVPEDRNPVHRLWRPTPGRTGMLGEPNRTFLLDRVSTPDGPAWVRNANVDVPEPLRDRLPVGDARPVESVEGFNDAMHDLHLPALARVADRVAAVDAADAADPADAALVESYADIADPLPGAGPAYDAVAVVEPGRVRLYAGDRWEAARTAAAGDDADGRLEERVGRVVGMVDPVSTHALVPLSSADRSDPDRVADANREAYDALPAVASG